MCLFISLLSTEAVDTDLEYHRHLDDQQRTKRHLHLNPSTAQRTVSVKAPVGLVMSNHIYHTIKYFVYTSFSHSSIGVQQVVVLLYVLASKLFFTGRYIQFETEIAGNTQQLYVVSYVCCVTRWVYSSSSTAVALHTAEGCNGVSSSRAYRYIS